MIDLLIPAIQALLFYIIPTVIGRIIVLKFLKKDLSYPMISYFIAGGFFLFVMALFIQYILVTLIPTLSFSSLFSGTVIVGSIGALLLNFFLPRTDLNIRPLLKPISAALIMATTIYALWKIDSPYSFNWDMMEHQTLVNNIFDGKLSFMTSRVTDTFGFDGYSSFFHTLIAASQVVLPTNMLLYWESIGFIHFLFVILASFFITKEVTENKTLAYIGMLLAAGIFDSYVSFTSLFFIPQTFTAVVFIFLVSQLIKEIKKGALPSRTIIVSSLLFLLLNHYIIGTAAVGIYLLIYFYSKYRQLIAAHSNRTFLVGAVFILAIAAIILSSFIQLDFLNSGEAAAFTPTFEEKFRTMRKIYGFLLAVFLPLGILTILRVKGEVEVLILTITFILASLVLLQLPYVMKFYVLARFFIHIILAIGIYSLIRLIQPQLLRITTYILLTVSLLTLFITNAAGWKEILRYRDMYTNIAPNEIHAAEFLKEKYSGQNALLISDPATQHILEPLTEINTQGGAYMNASTRTLLDAAVRANDTHAIADLLYEINDNIDPVIEKRLLAVSGRYFLWQYSAPIDKESLSFNIWYPSDLTLENSKAIQFLLQDEERFNLVYSNETIAILEVIN